MVTGRRPSTATCGFADSCITHARDAPTPLNLTLLRQSEHVLMAAIFLEIFKDEKYQTPKQTKLHSGCKCMYDIYVWLPVGNRQIYEGEILRVIFQFADVHMSDNQ